MKLFPVVLSAVVYVALLFSASEAQEKTAAAKSTTIIGTVVSVNAAENTIIVKVEKAIDTLSIASAATIMSGKREITLSDIKANAKVTVACKMVDGKMVATFLDTPPRHIWVMVLVIVLVALSVVISISTLSQL